MASASTTERLPAERHESHDDLARRRARPERGPHDDRARLGERGVDRLGCA